MWIKLSILALVLLVNTDAGVEPIEKGSLLGGGAVHR